MIVRDLVDLHYDVPFVIDLVEYTAHSDIPRDVLLSCIDNLDLKKDRRDGMYKAYINTFAKKSNSIMEKGN